MNILARMALLSCAEPFPEGADAPGELCIFKFGKTEFIKNGERGFYTFSEADADNLIAEQAKKGVEIPFDYDHAMLKAAESGNPAPAAGFIGKLLKKADGLYAQVSYWTQKARDFIRSGEYRYISPTFKVSRSKQNVTSLYNVALTNKPATLNAPVLLMADGVFSADDDGESPAKHKPTGVEKMKGLLKLLNLADDTPEEGMETALSDAVKVLLSAKNDTDEFLKLHDAKSLEEVTVKIGSMVPAAEKIALTEKLARRDAEDAVQALMDEGKITAAMKDKAVAFALKDLASFKDFYADVPVIAPLDKLDRRILADDARQEGQASDQESTILKNLNLSDDQIEKAKKQPRA